jgi:hypothetical protein
MAQLRQRFDQKVALSPLEPYRTRAKETLGGGGSVVSRRLQSAAQVRTPSSVRLPAASCVKGWPLRCTIWFRVL